MAKKKMPQGTKEGKKSEAMKKPMSPKMISSRERKVEFFLQRTEAREVCLAGEFNGWNPHALPMVRSLSGEWKAMISLPPGRYEFKPLADGAWIEDLPCTVRVEGESFMLDVPTEEIANSFGTRNFAVWIR